MQAIITKYRGPTDRLGSRITAECERGKLTIAWDHGLDAPENHRAACDALCAKFDAEDAKKYGSKPGLHSWSRAKASGCLPDGRYVFCFIQDRVLNHL
jgi:hypothetical protein